MGKMVLMIISGVLLCVAGGFLLIWLYGRPGFLQFEILGTDMAHLFHAGTINLSVAVWVGVIALVGIATDTGVVMATYLVQRFRQAPPTTISDIHERTVEAGKRRVRPCLMTTATTALALLPVVTSQGRGADVMVPMALPSMALRRPASPAATQPAPSGPGNQASFMGLPFLSCRRCK